MDKCQYNWPPIFPSYLNKSAMFYSDINNNKMHKQSRINILTQTTNMINNHYKTYTIKAIIILHFTFCCSNYTYV